MSIDPCMVMHPEDLKAIAVLRKIPGFDYVIRKFMEKGGERLFRGENLANYVRVTKTSLPRVYNIFKDIVARLGIKEPELYVYNDPVMNAYTYGETNTFVAISSGAIETMTYDELKGVIAHECGHIVCHHTFYNTLLRSLLSMADFFKGIPYFFLGPIYLALSYWSRRSEFSADRCAAIIVGADAYQKVLVRLASGLRVFNPKGDELLAQAYDYHEMIEDSWWNKIQQNCRMAFYSHPQMCERAYELARWGKSGIYRNFNLS